MSLRSLLLIALLLAASAAAQGDWQSDMLVSMWLNMSATKLCAVDAPSRCHYVPYIDLPIDPRRTLAVAVWRDGTAVRSDTNPVGNYYLLRYVTERVSHPWYVIEIPRPGLLYSSLPFSIGPAGSRAQTPSTSYTACGRTYPHAYYVAARGAYNITPFRPPYYILDLETCVEYRIAAHTSAVANATQGWFSLYLAELTPHTRSVRCDPHGTVYNSYRYSCALNGTLHAYLTYFQRFLHPSGSGFYIMGPHVSMTLVVPYFYHGGWRSYRGPVAFDALHGGDFRITTGAPGDVLIHYNIGPYPGDGFMMAVLLGAVVAQGARLAYLSENATGFFVIQHPSAMRGAGYATFHRRYAVVDVALEDALYLYNVRGLACPIIGGSGVGWSFNRLDRVYEIEVCNNRTDTVYVVLYYGLINYARSGFIDAVFFPGFYAYMYGDAVPPGRCARLRWDAAITSKPQLRVYTTPQGVCAAANNFTLSTTNYNPGWRYNLIGNSLVPVGPIAPDYDYASLLKQLLDLLAWRHRNLFGNLSDWLNRQRNATQTNATHINFTSFLASQPQFVGVIRMESATSTWLRTTLNELQKWRAVGVAPSLGAAPLPAVPAAIAPAAAAAVAVAWAASRRDDDVATTAAVAGIALALFGVLMTLIYGTGSLTLVALGVVVAAAAAAWRRIS